MAVNLISLLISLASIALAVFFFLRSRKEKRIAYRASFFPSRIFDRTVSSPRITVVDDEGKPMESNIYVTEVMLWNAGDLPIEASDVRKPLTIELNDCDRILDYKILLETHPDIFKFSISEDAQYADVQKKKALLLKWDHLDPNVGIKIQIIFTSAERWIKDIEILGNIVGMREFVNANRPALLNKSTRRLVKLLQWVFPISLIALPFLTIRSPVKGVAILGLFVPTLFAFAWIFGAQYLLSRRLKTPFQQQRLN
jgi:hypothetical protein